MPDLVEFLLARIAEDEAAVNDRTRHLAPGGWSYLEQFGDFGDDERWMIEIPAARVLAECDAKRELLALADPFDFADDGGTGMSEHADKIHRLLALPYADHPDYRQEWKP